MTTYRKTWLVLCAALAAAGIALASISAPAVLCVLLSCAAVVVFAVGWWTTPTRSGGHVDALARAFAYVGTPYAPVPTYLDLRLFTDEQLCHAWRASHDALSKSSSVEDTLRVVDERQTYLDELARRHPDGLTAWLASQPGPAGDPLPRLTDTSADQAGIDWDELIAGQDW